MKIESVTKITVIISLEDILTCVNQHHSLKKIGVTLSEKQLAEVFEKKSVTVTVDQKENPTPEVTDLKIIFDRLHLLRALQLRIFSQNVEEHRLMTYFEKSFSLLPQTDQNVLYDYCSCFKADGLIHLTSYGTETNFLPSFKLLGELYFEDLKRAMNTSNSDIVGKQDFTLESEVSFIQLGLPKSKALAWLLDISPNQNFILGTFISKFDSEEKAKTLLEKEGIGPRLVETVSIFKRLYNF